MLSKTKVNERQKQKTNSLLADAIFLAKKNNLKELASAISCPAKRQSKVNVSRLNTIKADVVIIPGKVLSTGEINRKMTVYALGFSKVAEEKLKKAGCEYKTILEALKKNPKLKGEIIK